MSWRWRALITVVAMAGAWGVEAQEPTAAPFELEPHLGAFGDAFDLEAGVNAGYLAGVRLRIRVTRRFSLVQGFAFGRTGDVLPAAPDPESVYRHEWLFSLSGVRAHLFAAPVGVALGLDVGVGWRRLVATGGVQGQYASLDFQEHSFLAPVLDLHRDVGTRTGLTVSVSNLLFGVLGGSAGRSPVVTVGVAIR